MRCALDRSTVLILAANPDFLSEAVSLLQQKSCFVIVAHDFKELEAACACMQFQVAVLGPALGKRMKKALALHLQERCPEVAIIEIAAEAGVDGAIHFPEPSGQELLQIVNTAISATKQRRGA
ncbi:MAG TPA: hypothetical protein VHN74_05200 [Candidatus Angelobacter sp.]|nr:hypothetical protein [Candidatus Angelobacter sp.]